MKQAVKKHRVLLKTWPGAAGKIVEFDMLWAAEAYIGEIHRLSGMSAELLGETA